MLSIVSKTSRLVPFYLLLLLSSLSFFSYAEEQEDNASSENNDTALYYELHPPFIVNLQHSGKKMHFLKIRIQVQAFSEEIINAVKEHNAPLRDAIIMLLSSKKKKDLSTAREKETLRKDITATIQAALSDIIGRKGIEEAYFTSFLIQ